MPRVFEPATDFQEALRRVDQVVYSLVDEHDPEALVYTSLTGLGRIHIIVVSDRLDERWQGEKEDRLWSELLPRLSEDEAELVSVFQVLSVDEALELNGPLDPPRLLRIGEGLLREWGRYRDELENPRSDASNRLVFSPEVSELLKRTGHWVNTCSLVIRSKSLKQSISDLESLREMRYQTQIIENGPLVLRQLPEHLREIVRHLKAAVAGPGELREPAKA